MPSPAVPSSMQQTGCRQPQGAVRAARGSGSQAGAKAELIPGSLLWAPALPRGSDGAAETALGHILRMEDYGDDKHLRGGRYQVCHYSPSAVGHASGPLALDQVLSFCRLLEGQLAVHGLVTVATKPGDSAGRSNAAVLVGAFLILLRGWSVQAVHSKMGEEARSFFPCSWSRTPAMRAPAGSPQGQGGPSSVLTVRACWEGIAMALRVGWLQSEHLKDEFTTNLVCSQYRRTMQEYDAAWLAPGHMLVCADPMTVIRDPNPSTCCHLTPPASFSKSKSVSKELLLEVPSERSFASGKGGAAGGRRLSVVSTTSTTEEEHSNFTSLDSPDGTISEEAWEIFDKLESMSEATVDFDAVERIQAGLPTAVTVTSFSEKDADAQTEQGHDEGCSGGIMDDDDDGADSVHTVCKDYGDTMVTRATTPQPPCDFVTWCQNHSVAQVVRVNFSNEPGLKNIGGSYHAATFEAHGIQHLDVPVHDHGGGVPDAQALCEVMEACKAVPKHQARLVHCKGGFGRSVLMACCSLISEFDVPGAALLGWVRIARPGAITTPQQERFLCQFRGAADLECYLRARAGGASAGASQGCCTIS